jgi:hypothetical protein
MMMTTTIITMAEAARRPKTYAPTLLRPRRTHGGRGLKTGGGGLQKPTLCRIKLGVGYSREAGLLRVNIGDVTDLTGVSETADLYVKMFLAPDPKKATKVSIHLAPMQTAFLTSKGWRHSARRRW